MWGSFSAVALEGLEQPGPCLVFSLVVVLLTYLEARQMVTLGTTGGLLDGGRS